MGSSPRGASGRQNREVELFFHDPPDFYNLPIDQLWEFMRDDQTHGEAHGATLRNFDGKELGPNRFEATYEVRRGGRWRWSRSRHTDYPPLCRIGEHLEGDYAGSIFTIHYWPVGRRTRVEVRARLRSNTLTAKALAAHWRESFANAYREDVAVLPAFLKARAGRDASAPRV